MALQNFTPEQAIPKIKQYCIYQERCHAEVKDKLYSFGLHRKDVDEIIVLLIEENYEYPTTYTSSEEMIYKASQPYSRFSYLKDAVDEIIEKILDEGGDVEFVSEKIMGHYNHIALIITSKKNNLYENNYPGD